MNKVITSLITVLLVIFVMLMGVPFLQGLFVDWNVQNAISYLEDSFNYIVLGSGSQVPDNLVPSQDNTYNLGSAGYRWHDLFIGGNATLPAISGVTSFSAAGDLDIGSHDLRAETFTSDVATGTAPLTVSSNTTVTNLSADLLDNYDITDIAGTLGATAWVVASDAPASIIDYASFLHDNGFPVWLCDGTDDNVEMQAAIDALPAGGRKVMLSEGTFHIAATVNVNKMGLSMEGQGMGTCLSPVAGLTNPMIKVTGAYCHLESFYCYGGSETIANNPACDAIDIEGCSRVSLENLNFYTINGNCIYYHKDATNNGCYYQRLTNIDIDKCLNGVYAVHTGATSKALTLVANNIEIHNMTGYGIKLEDIVDVWFSNVIGEAAEEFLYLLGDTVSVWVENFGWEGAGVGHYVVKMEASGGNRPAVISFSNGEIINGDRLAYLDARRVKFANVNFIAAKKDAIVSPADGGIFAFNSCHWQSNSQDGKDLGYYSVKISNDRDHHFWGCLLEESNVDKLFSVPAATNYVRVSHCSLYHADGAGDVTDNLFQQAHANEYYTTENSGTATVANGTASIVVNHGLATTPTVISVVGQHSEVSDLYVDTVNSDNFTIHAPSNVTADRDIYWEAKVR